MRNKHLSPSMRTFQAYDKPLVLERGEMQYMWDSEGNKYIDLLGQNLCISVGHGHPVVTEAAIAQMKKLPHCTTMYYHEQPSNLAKELIQRLPPHPSGEDWVCHFVCSGSEAVDLAIQMARCYTGRSEVLALHKAYHGLQGYAAAVTNIGKAEQECYNAMFTGVSHVTPNRIEELENWFAYSTGGKIAGFIAEPLQGYGGILPLDKGYLKAAFELCHNAGGVAIADEVQTGYCRCGNNFWGFQDDNNDVMPDMVTIAKGMGNGIGIIGAVIARRSIAEAFATKMWFNTYGSNPVATAAARAVLKVIDDDKILENCNKQGKLFRKRLSVLCEEMPSVLKEIRGNGLFQGLEIAGKNVVASGENAYEMHRRLLKYGVVVGRGSAAGNVFRLQPPMCIQEHDVNKVCDSIEEVAREFKNEKGL